MSLLDSILYKTQIRIVKHFHDTYVIFVILHTHRFVGRTIKMTNTTLREWVGRPGTHTVHDHRLIPLPDWKIRGNVELQRYKRLARLYAAGVALRP